MSWRELAGGTAVFLVLATALCVGGCSDGKGDEGADDAGVGLAKSGSNYVAYYEVVADGGDPGSDAAAIATWNQITSASTLFTFQYDTVTAPEITGPGDYDLYIGVLDAVPSDPPSEPNFAIYMHDIAVDQESDRPIINVDNLDEAAATNAENGLGQNPSILVTIQDDDQVSVADLEYRIDVNNDQAFTGATAEFAGGTPGAGNDKWEDESIWYPFEEGGTPLDCP